MKRFAVFFTSAVLATVTVGCATDEFGNRRPLNNTEMGALIGAGTGAVLGALVKKDKRAKGALIGAIGGGLAGGAVGTYMDSQKKDLEKVLAPEVQSGAVEIQKVRQNELVITMTAQTSFDVNSTEIKPAFHSTLDKIADVLNHYGKTHLTIVGHTDNVGSNEYNQTLSEKRAAAVNSYLSSKGVISQRLAHEGHGETAPRATNATDEGRRLNRRVEIIVEPVVADSQG